MLAVTAGVVPIIVNKSTEGEGFDWIKPHLREIWTALFILYVLYGHSRPSAQGIAMTLHQSSIKPWIGYAVMGALGCGVFSGYWWFTGTIARSTSGGVLPRSPNGGVTTAPSSSIVAERHEQARSAIASLDAASLMILRKIPAGGLLPEHIHNALTRDGFDGNPDPVIRALKSANIVKSDFEGRILIIEDIATDVRDLLALTPATTADKTNRLGAAVVTTDEIAEAVAKRLERSQVTAGPFPPFSLGGSLEKEDLFDIIGDGYPGREVWRPIKKSHDVEIDWDQFKSVELIVDAAVRGGQFSAWFVGC